VGHGSGVAISPTIILTAAHNIYDKEYKCENTKFKFYLGADGEAEEYFEVQSWKYPQ
jgi:V8-like Glu-specific endopeptidase